jgi:hypothetical protein
MSWGAALYIMRGRFRRLYGVGELVASALFAHAAVRGLSAEGGERNVLQGAAAVYLAVRAIDNFMVGHREAMSKRAAQLKMVAEDEKEDAEVVAAANEAATDDSRKPPA